MNISLKITYIGGPTSLLELGGLRLLTDPTFDPAGTEYPSATSTLHKTAGPAIRPDALGHIDAVLLSHDHHSDNLDRLGRDLLKRAGVVLTTTIGADRLGGNARGLAPWQSFDLPIEGSSVLRVTGTPARHGPASMDRGPVIGFMLALRDYPDLAIYVSGDTVWYEGVAEVIQRFPIRIAILNLGAARVPEVGLFNLTFTAAEALEFTRACPQAIIVPLHYEGWQHFSESRREIEAAFAQAGMEHRLYWLELGVQAGLPLAIE
ncbi:MAG: MBL fold metallo-hydrolase [Chloroflexi bacterium]|nr:MBL fold metallo-hydrolase [Chloroflexota bacterium]